MQDITHSELQTTQPCLRRHKLAYGLALRPIRTAAPLRMGSALHGCFDLVKTNTIKGIETPSNTAVKITLSVYDGKPADPNYQREWEIERAKIAAMLYGYFWRWGDRQWDVIESELEFDLPIINPATGRASRLYRKRGKLDGIIKLADGRIALLEHKSTSDNLDDNSPLWRLLRIDAQISMYYLAALEMGYQIETIIYDVLYKPQQIPFKETPDDKKKYLKSTGELYAKMHAADETPDAYYQRIMEDITAHSEKYYIRKEIPRTQNDLLEAQQDLWNQTQWLNTCSRTNCWPRTRDNRACMQYGRCTYFDLCTGGYDINSGIVPDGFERVDNVHPELTENNNDTDKHNTTAPAGQLTTTAGNQNSSQGTGDNAS